MHPNFYKQTDSIARWMQHSKESVIGAGPTPGVQLSNVMITTRGNDWYLHLLPDFKKKVSARTGKQPSELILLRTGERIPFDYNDGFVTFVLDPLQAYHYGRRRQSGDVITDRPNSRNQT